MLCFFETPVLRFALLPYYRRIMDVELLFEIRSHIILEKNLAIKVFTQFDSIIGGKLNDGIDLKRLL